MYKRTTIDIWTLEANYGDGEGWEYETGEFTRKKAQDRRKEYETNAPRYAYRVRCIREKVTLEHVRDLDELIAKEKNPMELRHLQSIIASIKIPTE